MRFQLLGLDVDGTLLDPEGQLTGDAHDAVREARSRGLRVVLCTGRRLRTARPIAAELELEGEIVVNGGAVVKDLVTGKTLHHAYLPEDSFQRALALLREGGAPLVYVDGHPGQVDFLVDGTRDPHPFQREYLDDHGLHGRVVPDLDRHDGRAVIMTSVMGDPDALAALGGRVAEVLGGLVRHQAIENKNYRGHILEILSPRAHKWTGLAWIAARAGIPAEAVAAIGDDVNDVEMLAGAGLGIAMGNASPRAREAADQVVASNAAGGVIEAIEAILRAE